MREGTGCGEGVEAADTRKRGRDFLDNRSCTQYRNRNEALPSLDISSHQSFPSGLSPPLCRLAPPLTSSSLPSHLCPSSPTSPPMAATASSSWMCGECGRVCQSHGGLMKHSSTHNKRSRVGGVGDKLHCVYHATLNGIPLTPPI